MDNTKLKQYIHSLDIRLSNDVEFWQDEYRVYPLAPVAFSLARALLAQQIFREMKNDLYHIIDEENE